ncbi:hypothetical protein GE09DRAFT_1259860 [Coniochaeta sp. 2T2.1]|nr:hypothetical protein GE09DRAFT_1259860 [Coniochaeta sp. 2T2.1]
MSQPCKICDAITHMIQTRIDKEFNEHIEITEADDAASWNCTVHEPVLIGDNLHDTGIIKRDSLTVWLHKNAGSPVFGINGGSTLHLVRRDDVPGHCGMGRVVRDPEWIDVDVIRGFINNCMRRHGEVCEGFPFYRQNEMATADLPRPAFFIDLYASCIVSGSQVPVEKPFVSLSYVRGSGTDEDAQVYLSLTKANLEALQQPGALDEAALERLNPLRTIPATFGDAMRLVALLGIQYLWIDRLCIIQDDSAAKEVENAKTAYIASRAAFVLAECDGSDATHGIRGVAGVSLQPRSFPQRVYPFGNDEAFIRMTGLQLGYKLSRKETDSTHPYPLRAPSRAETATARRVLCFEMDTVQWACRS